MKKLMSILLAVALTASILAGCGANKTEPKPDSTTKAETTKVETTEAAVAEAPVNDAVKLSFMCWQNADMPKTLQAFIATAKSKYNIELEMNNVPTGQYYDLLKTKIAANEPPDLMFAHNAVSGPPNDLAKKGIFADVKGFTLFESLQPQATEVHTLDGKVFGASFTVRAAGVLYNKKIFKDSNIVLPKNVTEFENLCDKLKAGGVIPMAAGFKDDFPVNIVHDVYQTQVILSKKLVPATAYMKGEVKFSDMDMLEAFKQLLNWKNKGYFQENFFGTDANAASTLFANGKTAMLPIGTFQYTVVKKANPDIDVGFFLFPLNKPGEKQYNEILMSGAIYISAKTKYLERAKQAMEAFLSPETLQVNAEEQGSIITLKGAKISNPFAQECSTELNRSDIGYSAVPVVYPPAVNAELKGKNQEILAGVSTPEQVAEKADAVLKEELAKLN